MTWGGSWSNFEFPSFELILEREMNGFQNFDFFPQIPAYQDLPFHFMKFYVFANTPPAYCVPYILQNKNHFPAKFYKVPKYR